MLRIAPLIEKFGEPLTRAYLQKRFADPQHFWEFASIFADLMQDNVPDFHREVIEVIIPIGKHAIGAPRGFAKSTIIGLIYVAWVSLNGFKWFIPYISDTHLQSRLIIGGLKSEVESNEKLKFIYPNAQSNRWGDDFFIINGLQHKTMVLPLGAGMKIRGLKFENHRPDLAIIDDLENLEAVYSADRRVKLKRWFDYDLEPAMDRYSKHLIYIGTILHYNSLLKQVLENEGKYSSWNTKKYKAIKDDGTSLWPARFSADYLVAIRDDPQHPDYIGSIVFAQEMQNEPQDDQDRIIKMVWVKNYRFIEKVRLSIGENDEQKKWAWLNTLERVAGVDVAISEKEQADYFAIYIYGFEKSSGNEYQLDLYRDKIGDINKQVNIICDKVQEWHLNTLGIETVAYQKGLYRLVQVELQRRGIYYCKLVEIKTDKDKIRRARIHSSAFEGGFVHLRLDHPNYAIIKRELE